MPAVGQARAHRAGDAPTPPVGSSAPRRAATAGLAVVLLAVAFVTAGGVDETTASSGNSWTEIALALLGLAAIGVGLLRRPAGGPRHGWVTVALMLAMFSLTAASIAWSVVPDSSWLASGQMLAYLAVFAAAVVLAHPLRREWRVVLGALVLWSTALCAWSLLVKVFPSTLAPGNTVGRLQAPFGYWNAIALTAALGLPCALWLSIQRTAKRVAAAPAIAVIVAVLVLSASRSADLAAAAAAVMWLIVVPQRLRALAVFVLGAAGGGAISVWSLSHGGLSNDNVSSAAQDHAGHIFGIVILIALVLVTIAGVVAVQSMDVMQLPQGRRRRLDQTLLIAPVIAVVVVLIALAASHQGLSGEISSHWRQLTNPTGSVSAVQASRVLQFGSSRPLYWHVALYVGDHHLLKGTGALGFSMARLLDPVNTPPVQQAHSYVFETYADLGILGLACTTALLLAWLVAAGRTLAVRRGLVRRAAQSVTGEPGAERIGLVTMAVLVVAFGVQGTLDWTWYFAGIAVPALLAAGWLAGRGAYDADAKPSEDVGGAGAATRTQLASPLDRVGTLGVLLGLTAAALVACWLIWRPLDSAQLVNRAERSGSLADAQAAHSADPLALLPYQLLSQLDLDLHRPAAAEAELVQATRVQPDNPLGWQALSRLRSNRHEDRAALAAAKVVSRLDVTGDALYADNVGLIQDLQRVLAARHSGG